LTVHNNNFEPMVEIIPAWIKGQDLSLKETKCPSFTIYKYRWISCLKNQEIKVQNWQKKKKKTIPPTPWFLFFVFFQLSAIPLASFQPSLSPPTTCWTSQHYKEHYLQLFFSSHVRLLLRFLPNPPLMVAITCIILYAMAK
jgi:hypothetical protein